VSQKQGKDAGRVSPNLLGSAAESFLNQQFGRTSGQGRWILGRADNWAYLNDSLLQQRGVDAAAVQQALATWLKEQPGVLTAYTRAQLKQGLPADDSLGQSVLRSFHPERSGDVDLILRPYYLLTDPLITGTLHGTPHAYDTHVPLLVIGPGIRSGTHTEAIMPQACAAILAHALNLPPPAHARAPVPEGLFTSP
jgi:hypothetical protein